MIPNFITSKGSNWIRYILLLLLIGILISSAGLLIDYTPQSVFLITSGLFTISGFVFWGVLKNQKSKTEGFNSYLIKITLLSYFLLLIGHLIGMVLFSIFLENHFLPEPFRWIISVSSILSVFPILADLAFESALVIPDADYKKWTYPEKTIVMDMENIDLSNFVVITFVFSKKFGERAFSNFQSKAPYPIKLGDLFYFFIQEWNYKNPSSSIEYTNPDGTPFGWYFTIKKSWWTPKRYLDADLSIRENNILVNQKVTAERVL